MHSSQFTTLSPENQQYNTRSATKSRIPIITPQQNTDMDTTSIHRERRRHSTPFSQSPELFQPFQQRDHERKEFHAPVTPIAHTSNQEKHRKSIRIMDQPTIQEIPNRYDTQTPIVLQRKIPTESQRKLVPITKHNYNTRMSDKDKQFHFTEQKQKSQPERTAQTSTKRTRNQTLIDAVNNIDTDRLIFRKRKVPKIEEVKKPEISNKPEIIQRKSTRLAEKGVTKN